jgi:hypothetical protein
VCEKLVPARRQLLAVSGCALFLIVAGYASHPDYLREVFTEPNGTQVVLPRLKEIIGPGDVVSAEGSLALLVQQRTGMACEELQTLTRSESSITKGSRLVILTFHRPQSLEAWAKSFTMEMAGDHHYRNKLLILTSQPLENASDFHRALIRFYSAKLTGQEQVKDSRRNGPHVYVSLAREYELLASLERREYLQDDAARHERIAKEYRRKGRNRARTMR